MFLDFLVLMEFLDIWGKVGLGEGLVMMVVMEFREI